MKHSKTLKAGIIIILVVIILAEGFLLYCLKQLDKQAIITVGEVSLELQEPGYDQETEHISVEPGGSLEKAALITLGAESEMAYLRAGLVTEGLTGGQRKALVQGIQPMEGWTYIASEGYYYYKDPVCAGQQVCLFEEVPIPAEWDAADNIVFHLQVAVEAVQASYITPKVNEQCYIMGWLGIEGVLQAKRD